MVVQPGNYSYYLEKRQQREAALRMQMQQASKGSGARRKNAQARKPERPRKLSFKEKAELEGMEDLILETEGEAEALAAKVNDPEFQAQHYEEIEGMAADLQALQARIAQLYERWEELEAIRLRTGLGSE